MKRHYVLPRSAVCSLILILVLGSSTAGVAAQPTQSAKPPLSQSNSRIYLPLIPRPPSSDVLPATPTEYEGLVAAARTYESAIQRLEEHLYVNAEGLLALSVDDGAAVGISNTVFNELRLALQQTNAQLQTGEKQMAEIRLRTNLASGRFAHPVAQTQAAGSCPGWTGQQYYWWGFITAANYCDTQWIITSLKAGRMLRDPYKQVFQGLHNYITWLNTMWGRGIYGVYVFPGIVSVWHQ